MIVGIDHIVIACEDLSLAAVDLERALGLRASGGGRHDALGTVNRLVWLGDSYLELIAVTDPARAATSWIGAPTLLALERGGGLATYALATDDLAADVARLRVAGSGIVGPIDGERRRSDDRLVRWSLAHPRLLGPGEPPFLIEHDTSAAEWTPAERQARAGEIHPIGAPVRLGRLEIAVPDVHRTTMRHVRTLGITFRPSLAGRGARDATVGTQTIRLRPSRPDQAPAGGEAGHAPAATIVLRADGLADAREANVLGCRFVIEPLGRSKPGAASPTSGRRRTASPGSGRGAAA